MSFSLSVSSRKGISVRTPMSRQTSVISDHISEFHGATAPSSMERDSSGTRRGPVHRPDDSGSVAGAAGALTVKGQLFGRGREEMFPRIPDRPAPALRLQPEWAADNVRPDICGWQAGKT